MKNLIAAGAICLVSLNAHTQSVEINGVGTHSCGKYLELRTDVVMKNYYQQWGAGFMAASSNETGKSMVTDLETYTAWLDKWCADDPSSKVVNGVIALGKRLYKR